ncbi:MULTISPECIES: hypothetical protein [unclassified Methylobacterium]|nr:MULTISPECIES: hypothetical protein [unclassified Methylobacterium]
MRGLAEIFACPLSSGPVRGGARPGRRLALAAGRTTGSVILTV